MVDPRFPRPTPEALLAHLDGEDQPQVAAALRASPEDAALAAEYAALQGRLVRALYRHDCPPTQALGDYAALLLTTAERVAIAAHLNDCPHCTGEVAQIRAFLAVEADPPPLGLAERGRRIVATLLSAPPLVAGLSLRGDDEGNTLTFQAQGFTITLDNFATNRRGYRSLVGLLERPAAAPGEALASLIAADGARRDEAIDESGNFGFDDLLAGEYRLEVRSGGDIVVIDGFRVGR